MLYSGRIASDPTRGLGGILTHTTIVIPTFQRPDLLERCLNSCRALVVPSDLSFDVLVVDNCPDASARAFVEQLVGEVSSEQSINLRYSHEPSPGISAARNRGLSLCEGQYVAFLDDDEAARPEWLSQLHSAQREHGAGAVFGCVEVVLPEGAEWGLKMFEKSVGRALGVPAGPIASNLEPLLGTGNSLFALTLLSGASTFAQELGLVGGEDTRVIAQIVRNGAKLVWAPSAIVDEAVEAKRATLRFLVERRFSSGQLRTQQQTQPGKGPLHVASWMAIGAGQSLVGGGKAVTQWAVGKDPRASFCDMAAGLGKLLWFPPFRLARYRRKKSQ